MSDSSRFVKNRRTPDTGGDSARGSWRRSPSSPRGFSAPAAVSASAATLPLTARATASPKRAASAKLPILTPRFFAAKSESLPESRCRASPRARASRASRKRLRHDPRTQNPDLHGDLLEESPRSYAAAGAPGFRPGRVTGPRSFPRRAGPPERTGCGRSSAARPTECAGPCSPPGRTPP